MLFLIVTDPISNKYLKQISIKYLPTYSNSNQYFQHLQEWLSTVHKTDSSRWRYWKI